MNAKTENQTASAEKTGKGRKGKGRGKTAKAKRTTTEKKGEPTGKEKQAGASKEIQEQNKNAIKAFGNVRKAVREDFDEMAKAKLTEDESSEQKNLGALHLCQHARQYLDDAAKETEDRDLILKDWKDNMRQVTKEMAADGHIFAEMGEARGDNPPTPKLTGHGKNVASIARGVIELDVQLTDKEGQPLESFTAVKNAVQEARRANDSKDVQLFREAVEECREVFRDALKAAKKTERLEQVEFLTEAIREAAKEFEALNAEDSDGEEEEITEETEEEIARVAAQGARA